MADAESRTIEQAAALIFEEAARHGEPLTLDVCRQIAKRLTTPRYLIDMIEPGDVARHHRQRYEEKK